jgi:tetratricopeptide (TPR) repeat protein
MEELTPATEIPKPQFHTSALAILGLILMIIGNWVPLLLLASLTLGIIALVKIRSNKETLKGKGLAILIIIASIVMIIFVVVDIIMLKNYCDQGKSYYKQKDYDKAVVQFTKAIEFKPHYAHAYYHRGLVYYDQKEYSKAIADYNKALEINPKLFQTYHNRGNTYYNQKEHDKAIADYNKALEIKPDLAIAYNNRGRAYNKQKKYDKAIADWEQTIKLNPSYEEELRPKIEEAKKAK